MNLWAADTSWSALQIDSPITLQWGQIFWSIFMLVTTVYPLNNPSLNCTGPFFFNIYSKYIFLWFFSLSLLQEFIIYTTYKICINQLFMLLERILVNSMLLMGLSFGGVEVIRGFQLQRESVTWTLSILFKGELYFEIMTVIILAAKSRYLVYY